MINLYNSIFTDAYLLITRSERMLRERTIFLGNRFLRGETDQSLSTIWSDCQSQYEINTFARTH